MSDPTRMITVTEATVDDGTVIPPWTPVWAFGRAPGGGVAIEWRNRRHTLPVDKVVASPVPPPSRGRLEALDPCVAEIMAGGWPLTERLRDDRMFIWWRCPHGAWVLEDTRGEIALYTMLIFVGHIEGEPDDETLSRHWQRWRSLPTDALNYLGVTLPKPAGTV